LLNLTLCSRTLMAQEPTKKEMEEMRKAMEEMKADPEMVKAMKPGSVIIDVSIDQGGCVATSRPTTLDRPSFVMHNVVHYCVPNMTSNIARTASRALANAAMPYLEELLCRGLDDTLRNDPGLAAGVYMYKGKVVKDRIGSTLGLPTTPLAHLL